MNFEAKVVREFLKYYNIEVNDKERFINSIAKSIKPRFGKPIYPEPGQSLAISISTPKIAALAFDRVYKAPEFMSSVPDEVAFYCATLPEIAFWVVSRLIAVAEEIGLKLEEKQTNEHDPSEIERENLRLLSSQFRYILDNDPTIIYQHKKGFEKEFPSGHAQILLIALSNIALVREEDLTWPQIIEFRQDAEARIKYRRLVRWIDAELKTMSPDAVQDMIAIRLDDYHWALKKHGIKTSIGALSSLIDPKFLGTLSATVAATSVLTNNLWATLIGSTLTIGRILLTFGTTYIDNLDERRKENYEVAYIHEIQRQFK